MYTLSKQYPKPNNFLLGTKTGGASDFRIQILISVKVSSNILLICLMDLWKNRHVLKLLSGMVFSSLSSGGAVPARFSVVMLSLTTTKATWGWKGLFGLYTLGSQPNEGSQGRTQGRNLEEGTEVEAMEDAASCLAPHAWLNLAFSDTQDYLPKGGTTHRGLAAPSSIIVEEKCPPGLLDYRTTWEGHFLSSGFLFSDNSSSGHADN